MAVRDCLSNQYCIPVFRCAASRGGRRAKEGAQLTGGQERHQARQVPRQLGPPSFLYSTPTFPGECLGTQLGSRPTQPESGQSVPGAAPPWPLTGMGRSRGPWGCSEMGTHSTGGLCPCAVRPGHPESDPGCDAEQVPGPPCRLGAVVHCGAA